MKFPSRLGVIFTLATLSAIAFSFLPQSRGSILSSTPKLNITQGSSFSVAASSPVPFKSCNPSSTWVRPSIAQQTEQLQSLPRYASDLDKEPLKNLSANFWSHKVFSFTSYGLSSRFEPIYFSGLWTILDPLFNCYDASVIEQLNTQQVGEVWLLSYQAVSIEWLDGVYVIVVEPTSQGIEMIRFTRQEQLSALPIKVITREGQEISVVSLDSVGLK